MSQNPVPQSQRTPDPREPALRFFGLSDSRIRFGLPLALLIVPLTAYSIRALFVSPELVSRFVMALLAAMLIAACTVPDLLLRALGLLLGMARNKLEGPATAWGQLTTAGKFARLLVTALGTALLAAPFAWLAWTVFR